MGEAKKRGTFEQRKTEVITRIDRRKNMKFLLKFLGAWIIEILLLSWEGFVFLKLWNWTLPKFLGLPEISMPLAIMVIVMVDLITHQQPYSNKNSNDTPSVAKEKARQYFARKLAYHLAKPAVALLLGWLTVQIFLT